MGANDKQIGGHHYKTECAIQHWDVVYVIFGGDYLIGNATKYLARVGKKGGPDKWVEDIDKAIHYLQKKREMLANEAGAPTSAYVNQG